MKAIIVSILLFAFCSVVWAEGTINIIPKELIEIAAKCNCGQVNEFYNRPGLIDPSYVYGFLGGTRENSAVFWCQKKNDSDKYLLALATRKDFNDNWKYEVIIETTNYPGGLTIVSNCRISLDNFVYISNPKKCGPKDVFPKLNVLLSKYDGVETYYYNHDGEWLISERD